MHIVRYLIVNADDFGATRGINRGIIEAHLHGVVTSTSLMVTTPWCEDAVRLARTAPDLGVGLHVDLSGAVPADAHLDEQGCAAELQRQLLLFEAMTGRCPTHLDSHHNSHRVPRLL